MPGRHPLPVLRCKVPGCEGLLIFLYDPHWGHAVPVDPNTLTEDDIGRIHESGNSTDVEYDPQHHALHKYLCKDPEWRPPESKRRR